MDKCIICQRVFDIVKPFLVELDDIPNCDFCERRWCIDCAMILLVQVFCMCGKQMWVKSNAFYVR